MKKITVILSGVGMLGYSGIAIMEFFAKHQLKPNTIVGSSSGALIAALWASGYNPQEALEVVARVYQATLDPKIDFMTSFFFFKTAFGKFSPDRALLKAGLLKSIYNEVFQKQRLETLPIKTIFQTTNVDIGECHLLKTGLIAEAVYAASAILPFYPAIKMNNLWLADGVFSEGLPLSVILEENLEVIIATNINATQNGTATNFMSHYASFLQKSLKIAAGPHTALMYDLYNDEIFIIPIQIDTGLEANNMTDLERVLAISRQTVASKEQSILELIGAS